MMVEMKESSQIILPNKFLENLGFCKGDKFEVIKRDGGIFLCPVVVYPKEKLDNIIKIINDHDNDAATAFPPIITNKNSSTP